MWKGKKFAEHVCGYLLNTAEPTAMAGEQRVCPELLAKDFASTSLVHTTTPFCVRGQLKKDDCRKYNRSRQPLHGFTLVELLVVIAIISVLAGLLLPALEEAIQNANTIKCVGRLRQLNMAIDYYTIDFENYLPPAGWHALGFHEKIFDNMDWNDDMHNTIRRCPQEGQIFDWPGNLVVGTALVRKNGKITTDTPSHASNPAKYTFQLNKVTSFNPAKTKTYADGIGKIPYAPYPSTYGHLPALRHHCSIGIVVPGNDFPSEGKYTPYWNGGLPGVANLGFLDGHVETWNQSEWVTAWENSDLVF